MIGVLNRSVFCLALCLLFASCRPCPENEQGRYKVFERKRPMPGALKSSIEHKYYLLDTKTGKIKELFNEEIPYSKNSNKKIDWDGAEIYDPNKHKKQKDRSPNRLD